MSDIDYVIVGAGPCGLTLAWCLSKLGKHVTVIEKNDTIGGAHRVKRVDGLFTEHGPRIYLNNYFTVKMILKDMGLNFDDYYTSYKFQKYQTLIEALKNYNTRELIIFATTFIKLDNSYKNITMKEYVISNNFSEKAKIFTDGLCRMTDGASMDRYTLYQFLQLINKGAFYKILQPSAPTDKGLLKIWKDKLEENGVVFLLNTKVTNIIPENDHINHLMISGKNGIKLIKASNYIMAIPPTSLVELVKNSYVPNAFGLIDNVIEWEKNVKYDDYISVIFHWNNNLDIDSIWGYPQGEWGIISIVLNDYMKFEDPRSNSVISTCISNKDTKSSRINKTPDECNEKEILEEVFIQLKKIYPSLPEPTKAIMAHNKYIDGHWISTTDSYVATKYGGIGSKSIYYNLYNCGTHNNRSNYSFTTMESAMDNAIKLIYDLEPETKGIYKIQRGKEVLDVLSLKVVFLVILFLFSLNKKR